MVQLWVRMGLHLGEREERDGDYWGPVLNTTARIEAAAHGGQSHSQADWDKEANQLIQEHLNLL